MVREALPLATQAAADENPGQASWPVNEAHEMAETFLLVQQLAGIGILAVSAVQELANPIGIITTTCANLLEALAEGAIDPQHLKRSIELIEQHAYRSGRIVELMGNYAQGTATGATTDSGSGMAITSPAAIVRDALVLVESQCQAPSGIDLSTEVAPELTTIFCDHNQIVQVLIALLANARQAMPPAGGVIRIRFWLPEPDDAALAGRLTLPGEGSPVNMRWADLFAFSVVDNGRGFDPAIQNRLFDPFFTTKSRERATGLGLSIAQNIVRRHRGVIWAGNNPDGGATFTVVMPRLP